MSHEEIRAVFYTLLVVIVVLYVIYIEYRLRKIKHDKLDCKVYDEIRMGDTINDEEVRNLIDLRVIELDNRIEEVDSSIKSLVDRRIDKLHNKVEELISKQ